MKTLPLLPVLAVLFAVFALPHEVSAQLAKNTNQSRKLGSVISGGSGNLIFSNADQSFIGSGSGNVISSDADSSFVGGGESNTASGSWATVVGGSSNSAAASYAAVLGGRDNLASGAGAVALGIEAKATNDGAFVWGNYNTPNDTVSTNNFSWTVRAHGGIRFITTLVDSATVTSGAYNFNNTNPALTNGVYLAPNSGSWASLSDSNAKTKVAAIKPREILSKLAALPVTEWEYKVDPNRRYIGPMAQDFHAAFGLGEDDKSITTLDSDGVMYAAIQGLVEELKERDLQQGKALAERDAKIDRLEKELAVLRARLDNLPPAP